MIAKHVAMRSVKKSSVADLVDYLLHPQRRQERVGCLTITNCHSNRPDAAVLEMLNTQAQNTRAQSDKTYHLILSFRPGEHVSDETLRAIESRICEGLGFGEHQRLSVAHHDTNNLHLHLAINKIHPTRYTLHDPYKVYRTIGRLCDRLEHVVNLQRDNHQTHKSCSQNRADDMERHGGVHSLMGWIQRGCLESLHGAQTWAELHEILRKNGLTITPHGQGLVITNGKGTFVRASSVSRALSKPALERRYGTFQSASMSAPDPQQEHTTASRSYAPWPIRTRIDTSALFARYQQERTAHTQAKTAALARAKEMKRTRMLTAKCGARIKYGAIKLTKWKRPQKLMVVFQVRRTHQATIRRITEQYQRERQTISDRYRRLTWADWLRHQAMGGNQDALRALRARGAAQGLQGDTISASGWLDRKAAVGAKQDSITKQGTIIYRVGLSAVRDDGTRLQVSRDITDDGVLAALRLAVGKYGTRIAVAGSDHFKERVVRVAAHGNLAIRFSDAGLEARRRQHVQPPRKESHAQQPEDRSRRSPPGAKPSPPGRGFDVGAGWTRFWRKPNLGPVGQHPPSEGKDRVRNLSELRVVRLDDGPEILLPCDVPRHVEHEGAQPPDRLQRGDDRSGQGLTVDRAITQYMEERNDKRTTVSDIPPHRRFETRDAGVHCFAGIRTIEGFPLALVQIHDDIAVLPIDKATMYRLRRLALGDPVRVTPTGALRIKTGRTL